MLMTTISDSFPLFKGPICMQDANTKAQMETALRCVTQIRDIKAIVRYVRRRGPQAISEAERRLKVAKQAFNQGNHVVLKEHVERERNARETFERPESYKSYKEFTRAYLDLRKAQKAANYFEIRGRMRVAEAVVQSRKDRLELFKQLWRKGLGSLKTDLPTLQGRCIKTICGALSLAPSCTQTDLESLSIPRTLQSDITTFCDCLCLIQGENISV